MAAIPKAKDFAQTQEQKKLRQAAAAAKAQELWAARIALASGEMVADLTRQLCVAIAGISSSGSHSKRVEIRLTSLNPFQGLPGDVVLYGHRTGDSWTARQPLGPAGISVFEYLQASFYNSGWYLI